MEEEHKEAEHKKKEKEETLHKQEEIRRMDQEDLERMVREAREREEKARCTTEEELVWCTLQEEEAARAAESPPQDKNDEVLDYYDDLDQDSEMASSSQGMVHANVQPGEQGHCPCVQSGVSDSRYNYAKSGDCYRCHHTRCC